MPSPKKTPALSNLNKLTTLLVVDSITDALPHWEQLGYRVTVRVPETGEPGFVILDAKSGELMLQTRASLRDDLPEVAKHKPSFLLYADVDSLPDAKRALPDATVLVDERKTFYGATEAWLELRDGVILGLSKH